VTPQIGNRGPKNRTVLLTLVAIIGAGLAAGIRTLPPLVERWRNAQEILAHNAELRRQLERPQGPQPLGRRFSEGELREIRKRSQPGVAVFVLQEGTPRRLTKK
jgi:hypothetical protein